MKTIEDIRDRACKALALMGTNRGSLGDAAELAALAPRLAEDLFQAMFVVDAAKKLIEYHAWLNKPDREYEPGPGDAEKWAAERMSCLEEAILEFEAGRGA